VFFGFMTFVGLGNGMVLPNATSGMPVGPSPSGRHRLGLGGAIMIGGGAALSALAGALLTGNGAFPLILDHARHLAAGGGRHRLHDPARGDGI
jgi:DHA1 family bicyclomycin/chloramphenicol resistance-like MFS transporter